MFVKTVCFSTQFTNVDFDDRRSSPSQYKSLHASSDLKLNNVPRAPRTPFVWVRLRDQALKAGSFGGEGGVFLLVFLVSVSASWSM